MSTFSERQRLETEAEEARARAEGARLAHLSETRHDTFLKNLAERAAEQSAKENAEAEEAERKRAIEEHEIILRAQLRSAYIAANGSELGFDDIYPELRLEHVKRATLARMAQKEITPADVIEAELRKLYKRS